MSTKKHKLKGRSLSENFFAVLAPSMLLLGFPALTLTSCFASHQEEYIEDAISEGTISTKLNLLADNNIRTLDIFVFNNDRLGRLDAYHRLESGVGKQVKVVSRGGEKIIVALANASEDRGEWASVNSLESLGKFVVELKDENPEYPVMSGTVCHNAVNDGKRIVRLEPLMSEIRLNSICCDFSSKPYYGKSLEDVKIYLTNVSSSCPIIYDSTYNVSSVINYGRLSPSDFSDFVCPEIIYAALGQKIDGGVSFPGIRLYCYPNCAGSTGISSPATRIVIEGTIGGSRYYYPININRGGYKAKGFSSGVERNRSYVLDVLITRLGSKDPDVPVESGEVELKFSIDDWKERDEEVIKY